MKKNFVYFFCSDLSKDPVAPHVYNAVLKNFPVQESPEKSIAELSAAKLTVNGRTIYFVQTPDTLSHIFDSQVDNLNRLFPSDEFEFAGVVNWHASKNAPDPVLCFHGIGDCACGVFAPSNGLILHQLGEALNESIAQSGLLNKGWSVQVEASHYSGVPYGCNPMRLLDWPVPQADIEIGSCQESWSNSEAADSIAKAIVRIAEVDSTETVKTAIYVGGMHFEPVVSSSMIGSTNLFGKVTFPHVLTYPWIISGINEETDDMENAVSNRIRSAAQAAHPLPDVIVFHDKAKAAIKNAAKKIAAELGIEAVNHKQLKK